MEALGFVLLIIVILIWVITEYAKTPTEQLDQRYDEAMYGKQNPELICPHCQVKGKVRTKAVDKKAGISGGKATAAILTGGVSILATGLSRKDHLTQAHCQNCESIWTF